MLYIVEIDDRLHVMLDIGEDATHDGIREAARLALEWRDRLLIWQGRWNEGGPNAILELMHKWQKGGHSYTQVADRINDIIASSLTELGHDLIAKRLMIDLDIPNQDFELDIATERIAEGRPPFERGYPLDREKVRNLLRAWREKRKPDDADNDE